MSAQTEPLSDAHGYGLASARPGAGIVGRFYYATDTATLYRDNGTTWDTLAAGGGGGGGGLTVKDSHGANVTGVTELRFGSLWVTNLGGGVAVVDTFAALVYPVSFPYTTNTYDGVFNGLGVNVGAGTFTNPHGSKYNAVQSSNQDGTRTADKATDHGLDGNNNCTHTQNGADQWWQADFGVGRSFAPTRLGIVGRSGGGQHPRNFKLQGSPDASTWTDLVAVSGSGPNDGTWFTVAVSGAASYRYIRILQTGGNSDGAQYLVIGEVEMWGTLS